MAKGLRLVAKDLAWSKDGVRVLERISFSLEPGTIAACVGPNGAGKTTLLNILSGWTSAKSGTISIDGRARSLTPERAHGLGLARRFDPPKIMKQLTVFDNVCLAAGLAGSEGPLDAFLGRRRVASLEKSVLQRAMPLLQQLRLEDKLRRLAGNLSVGEQKLLDFVLGLVSAPRCLLLDEPLKDRVDDARKGTVSSMLRQFAQDGGSALVVEHDLQFIRDTADRVLVLDGQGRLAREGDVHDPETWKAVKRVYYRAYDSAATSERSSRRPPQSTTMPRISASGLTARYEKAAVLHDATIQLAPGEIAVLRGENGAGKSTLLFALAGLVDTGGSVRLDGEDITRKRPHERARLGLVLVAQEHKVFPSMTVAENILLGKTSTRSSPEDHLQRAFSWFPELRARAGLSASRLSAGQKQMVALARAFLADARCLLLDEPSSGLDPGVRPLVRSLIRSAADGGAAILLVEHVREAVHAEVDSTYFLRGGLLERVAIDTSSAQNGHIPQFAAREVGGGK